MSSPRPAATLIVRISTLVLPGGPARDRYRQELLAELHDLEARRQWRHAVRFLASAWSLRRAVKGQDALVDAPTRAYDAPMHCRLHLYHHYRIAWTDDGHRYLRCRDCGLDHPGTGNGPADVGTGGVIAFRSSV